MDLVEMAKWLQANRDQIEIIMNDDFEDGDVAVIERIDIHPGYDKIQLLVEHSED